MYMKVSGFVSSRLNWVPPPPHPQESVAPPSFRPKGETHSLAGEGLGGTQSRRRDIIDTLVLYRYTTV